MRRILVDTNVYSGALAGNPEVVEVLQRASHIGICSISIGELLFGFRGGRREKQNRKELRTFLDSPRVSIYPVDVETAEHYSSCLNQLRERGTPIPTNDIWIAAVALRNGLALYTLDKHFKKIQGLLLV
jgi:predicted nucleic acid-binding protein